MLLGVHGAQGRDDGHVGAAEDDGRGGGRREAMNTRQPNHERRDGTASALLVAHRSARSAGLSTNRTIPATIESHWKTKIEMAVSQMVATQTPRAGPTMKENSVQTESSDSAVRRCSRGPGDEDLAQDRERRHREQSAERGQPISHQ